MEQKVIRVSVRNLVEFLLRSGDLDNRYSGRRETEAMQAGSRLHRKIQGKMGSGYQAEVSFRHQVLLGEICISVEGRADGVWTDDGMVTVDEIKGTYRDIQRMDAAMPVHLAQAKCYAYFYADQHQLEHIRTRMIYANLDTEETEYFTEDHTYVELKDWFFDLMDEYEKWISFEYHWKIQRAVSLRCMEFPFTYREGQKELAVSVYKTILRKKRIFIQAPTGVGKTLSTLFPSLKAMGEGLNDKIFYLTARTITRTVAADAMDILREQKIRVKSMILTAKEKLCICEEMECNPEHCPCAKGHFDRINDAVFDLWVNGPDSCTREVILEQAHRYQVCPFELNLDLALWMDVIICDYNYVFDPNVYLKRFFGDGIKGEYQFLIDEAHNLVERGRTMYSASLCKEDFLQIKRLIKGKSALLTQTLDRCNRHLLILKRECEDGYQRQQQIGGFTLHLMHLMSELDRFMEHLNQEELRKTLTDFYFDIRDFLNISDRLDENYEIYTELAADGRFYLRLFCVRPAVNLRLCLDKGLSTVLFSATLLPVNYYKDLLTGDMEDYAVYARSPFDTRNRLLLIGTDVSSRYTRRCGQEYEKIASYIYGTAKSCKGNYLVFFPSYQMLDEVYCRCIQYEDIRCIRQNADMDEEEREIFLEQFHGEQDKSMAAFCVMGGIFSEGIDLPGDRLIGALIIGTGLPMVCREREILKEFFDRKGLDGFAYAYLYPGMNKVLQAAGRVIRTDEDQGVILLLDERFMNSSYKKLFPREWEEHGYCQLDSVISELNTFWSKSKRESVSQHC
ncbi:MAG: ATP-dependent DNA helicase [Lachnospiraceae bacterium]|nr:ATP-dependent DNA helicase [Lachnospiraceae bacterium]